MSNYLISKKHEYLILEYSKNINQGSIQIKEDKWDDDAEELRDLIAKQQKRLEREKELGENENPYSHAWLKLNRKDKLNYLKKGDELLEYIKDAFYEGLEYSDLYLYEDRHQSILEMYDDGLIDYPDKYVRATDIFTIGLQLSQMVRYGGIIKDTKKHGIIPKVKLDINENKKGRKTLPRFLKKHHEIRV